MAKQNVYTLTDYHTYAASTATQIDIPETGYISHISVLVKASITGGTAVSAAEDALARLIDAMSITAAGGKNYYDITDGRQGYYKEHLRLEGKPALDDMPSAGATSTVFLEIIIHPGLNPFDLYDRSVVIPAAELSNLKSKITWGAASALGTGFTVNSAYAYLTVHEWQLDPGESRDSLFPQGINVPLYEARELGLTASKSNLGQTDDFPVGSVLNSILIMVLDSSGDRADGEVDEVGIIYPKKQKAAPFRMDWYPLKHFTKSHYSLTTALTGLTQIPLEWITRRAMGMDLTAAMVGDVQLGLTTSLSGASATIHLLYYSIALG